METPIEQIVAKRLKALMEQTPTLDTLKKVSDKSKVGYGTIRRARTGQGNVTIKNLDDIARAFGLHAADLLRDDEALPDNAVRLPRPDAPLLDDLLAAARQLNEPGLHRLIERAESLRDKFPRAQANHAR